MDQPAGFLGWKSLDRLGNSPGSCEIGLIRLYKIELSLESFEHMEMMIFCFIGPVTLQDNGGCEKIMTMMVMMTTTN